jgi:hypothetical protein
MPEAFSAGRLRRSTSGLAARAGAITPQAMRTLLRDHGAAGTCLTPDLAPDREEFYTICMHQGPSRTAATLVVELPREEECGQIAWASFGRPCASVFFPVVVAGDLPEVLTRGSDEPSAALWWVFEALGGAAESSSDVARRIRSELDELECALDRELESARGALRGASGDARRHAASELMDGIAVRLDRAARALLSSVGG